MPNRTAGGPRSAEQLIAEVSRARWDALLRLHHRRLPKPDLEDCLQQATLELVVQARRGGIPAERQLIAGALEHKFQSRIIDRHRAVAGRSPQIAANAHAAPIDALGETLPGPHDTAQAVVARDELRRITSRLRDLTPDQRLVLAHETFAADTPVEFCERHGWTASKYRKVGQRARARLDKLLQPPEQQRKPPDTPTRQTTPSIPRDADPPGRDPLAPHRRVLGDDRSDQLSALAEAAAPRAARQTRAELLAERDHAAGAWKQIDRAGAYETRAIQRDRDLAAARAQQARAAAKELEQRAASTGRHQRGERDTLAQAAAGQHRIAEREQREVHDLDIAEERLHQRGRHLDDWIANHGAHAATWLAAEHELAQRREQQINGRVELAVTDPPDHLRERIGDPPDHAAPHRPEWEALARRLEHDRLAHEAATADGSRPTTDAAADRDLGRRVQRLRHDQGLDPPDRAHGHDIGVEI